MSRLPYPAYRSSGIPWLGDVPAHWEVKRLRFVADVNPSSPVLRRLPGDAEVSFVPMDNVGEGGGLRLDTTRLVDEVGSGYTEFQDGDVIVAKITPCFENGKGALAEGLTSGAAYGTTELHVLRSTDEMDAKYLFLLTISSAFRSIGEAEMYGAGGQKRVPTEFMQDVSVPVPPVEEQTAIAAWLDAQTARIDALVEKQAAFVRTLGEQRAALVTASVTQGLRGDDARAAGLDPSPATVPSGIAWLGDVPAHWEVKRLRFVAPRIDNKIEPADAEDFPYVGLEHVEPWTGNLLPLDGEMTPTGTSNRFLAGSVLFGKLRPYLAKATIAHFDGVCSSELLVLNPEQHMPRFLLYTLLTRGFIETVNGSTFGSKMPRASWDFIGDCRVPVPPVEEQAAIAAWLDVQTARLDALVATTEAALARLREYRAALVTAAVTGQIDVREGVD